MLWLAATTLEKLKALPTSFWINVGMAMGIFIAIVLIVRYAAKMNKLVLTLVIFLLITVVGFQWIFERNEPKFMTKTIDKIAPYFPSKIKYNEYQAPK